MTELALRGLTQREIAALPEFSHISRRQVGKDLELVVRRWQQQGVVNMAEFRQRKIEQLDIVIREAFAAHERGKADRRTKRTRRRVVPGVVNASMLIPTPPDGQPSVLGQPGTAHVAQDTEVRVESRSPDSRDLLVIVKAIELQARLKGCLDTPLPPEGDEPVRRVVVYMERGGKLPSDDDPEPLPPGPGQVIDLEPSETSS